MLVLSSTTDKVEVVTSSTADIAYVTTYAKADATSSPMVVVGADNKSGLITSATTTDLSGSPAGANDRWSITSIELRNAHASTANDVTVRHVKAGASGRELIKVTLAAGEKLLRDKNGVWFVYDTTGAVKMGATAASDTLAGMIQIALQADQETGTSTVLAVTPGRQQYHPSSLKAWVVCGVTANILASYNITSLTDTGTGDVAVTIATDFSSANYTVSMSVQRINSTAAEANERIGTIKTASLAAGSFSMDCWDTTTTTNVIKDPTTWHAVCCGDFA